jgi:hypothetical protein
MVSLIIDPKPANNIRPLFLSLQLIVVITASIGGSARRLPKGVNRVALAPLAFDHVLEHAQPHQVF